MKPEFSILKLMEIQLIKLGLEDVVGKYFKYVEFSY